MSLTVKRIRRENQADFNLISQIVTPEVLHANVPRLAEVAEARQEHKNRMNTIQALGKTTGATGFDPTRKFQYVANIDQSVWHAILHVFAQYSEDGKLVDDGHLYVKDDRGNLILNRPFFYTLLEVLENAGYHADMRGKIKLT